MSNVGKPRTAQEIQQDWDTNPRWNGITRDYTADQVADLQGSVIEEHTLARRGSEILWDAVTQEGDGYINALGALTGNQAVQQVRAGLKAVYLSGWQVAGDANLSGHTYPDQSSTQRTPFQASFVASTTHCCVPMKSHAPKATPPLTTGLSQSSRTAKLASVEHSTSTNSRRQ